ncbi:MAG: hypothetical protein ACTSVZ_09370 [Promethearchaeota archaeon]
MKLLHIIGKVGSGKSHFTRKYFPQAPVFDIKDVYEKYDVTPADLRSPGAQDLANPISFFRFHNHCHRAPLSPKPE